MVQLDFSRALEFLEEHRGDIAAAEERQRRFWTGGALDTPLMIQSGELPPAGRELPAPDYLQAAEDPELMLAYGLRQSLAGIAGESDLSPSIRPNLGCAVTLSCIGLEQQFFPDKMPWLDRHLQLEEIRELDPAKVQPCGTFARGLEMIAFFRERLNGVPAIYPMDTQGPFDLAHLIMGDDIFLLMYDEPEAVHQLMRFCTAFLEKLIRRMKEAIGEPLTVTHYLGSICSDNFGIRICEDTAVLLAPDQIAEFVIPYSRQLAEHFGGAFCHYCGRNDELTAQLLAEPAFKVINFGQIPGKPELHDFQEEMEKIAAAGKQYFGCWSRLPGERFRDYLLRLRPHAEAGVLAPVLEKAPAEEFASPTDIVNFWKAGKQR